MNKNIVVVAPHPDDETIGCGGTILRHIAEADEVHWLIMTSMYEDLGFSRERMEIRDREIQSVAQLYGFASVNKLGFPTTKLDTLPFGTIVQKIDEVFKSIQPETVYVPYRGDVHTDHKICFDAAVSSTKWFRQQTIKRVLAYETISETEFGINPDNNGFRPNVFVNIENYLEKKLEILKEYAGEIGQFPFPRSEQAIRALAMLRGSASGTSAAEAFVLLKEIV
jgi:LmbE family N-acetylglucosaminyl deacetylase